MRPDYTRLVMVSAVTLALSLVADWRADAQAMGGLEATRPDRLGAQSAVVDVKFKCGIHPDGSFGCKKVDDGKNKDKDNGDQDKKDKDQGKEQGKDKGKDKQQEDKASKGNKCRGKNDCGPGFRDLDVPNKYGACCEAKTTPPKDDNKDTGNKETGKPKDEPKSGGCRSVEKMSEMSCTAPFGATSCGAMNNGKMTCCCVK